METTKPTEISSSKMFEGYNKRYKHYSPTLGCSMTFHIYFPPTPKPSSPDSHKFPFWFRYCYWPEPSPCSAVQVCVATIRNNQQTSAACGSVGQGQHAAGAQGAAADGSDRTEPSGRTSARQSSPTSLGSFNARCFVS